MKRRFAKHQIRRGIRSRWRQSLFVAALVAGAGFSLTELGSVGTASADDRPWPEEWPIELPPYTGRPPTTPRIESGRPASRSAVRVVERVERIRRTMVRTRYQHHARIRERAGQYYWDCSLMVDWVLRRAAPRSARAIRYRHRALAVHYANVIERAPTDRYRRGWMRIEHIADARPGDVFAWRRPDGFPSRNSGHVGFVMSVPTRVPGLRHAWAVRVADATRSFHQDDTRPWPGEGGFGMGTIVFLTDGHGHGTHYGWHGTRSGGYVVTPIFFGRVGP